MRFLIIFLIIIFSKIVLAELLKPSSILLPEEVISIQLKALQKNNIPYKNAGIIQTWEFAHPLNRKYTGPLKNFVSMMYSSNYSIMLNHLKHECYDYLKKVCPYLHNESEPGSFYIQKK